MEDRSGIRVGIMERILGLAGPEALRAAGELGFEGVELATGDGSPNHEYFTRAGQQALADGMRISGVEIPSLTLGAFNTAPLALKNRENHARGREYVRHCLDLAQAVGAKVLLIACFGAGELLTDDDGEALVAGLAPLVAEAMAAGCVLALENTLAAERNIDLVNSLGPEATGVYFDVSNAVWWKMDPAAEIRKYGEAGMLTQVHFKDGKGSHSNAMLGEGHVDFPACAQALRDVGYGGWVVLETAAPNDRLQDAKTNLEFSRRCLT